MLTLASLLAGGSSNIFLQQIENGITLGAMYALVALGYTLVYGIIELINFAHGDVFMWSTVVTFVVVERLGVTNVPATGIAVVGLLVLLLVIGMGISGFLNAGIERVAYRRLRKAPRLAPLIAAIGASFILETVVALWQGTNFYSFPTIFPTGSFNVFGARVTYLDIFIVILSVGLMYGLATFINTSRLGRAMRATAQDPEAAALMGVNINQTISVTFLIGGALAGAAGVVYNMYVGQVWFLTGFQLGLIAFTAAVLGGIGNIYGAVLGGFLIGLIDSLAIQYLPDGFAWSLAVVFAILVLILVFRPSGLLGQRVPDKV
ncbi:MAG: branched-chain amino acid ABC transporter permease [Ktedonobacterales bacterium]